MALPTVLLICIPQDRSLLSSTPRYGWCLTSASLVFIIVYGCMTRFLFLETLSVEHLETLNFIRHLSAHAISWSDQVCCRLVVSQMFSMVRYNKQSSANNRMWVLMVVGCLQCHWYIAEIITALELFPVVLLTLLVLVLMLFHPLLLSVFSWWASCQSRSGPDLTP